MPHQARSYLDAPVQPVSQTRTATTQDSFTRIEDKFFAPVSVQEELFRTLGVHLSPSYPDPKTRFTQIRSLYLDSKNLEFYRSHFLMRPSRFKLRIREYGPNGIWQKNNSHLELKGKQNEISKKSRFLLSSTDQECLLRGEEIPLSQGLLAANCNMPFEKLARRVSQVNSLIREYQVQPISEVIYLRHAFEKDGLRVTVDSDIRFKILSQLSQETLFDISQASWINLALNSRDRYNSEHPLIIEVKHSGTIPTWARDLLVRVGAKDASFSKYCFSISEHLCKELPVWG